MKPGIRAAIIIAASLLGAVAGAGAAWLVYPHVAGEPDDSGTGRMEGSVDVPAEP